MTTTHLQEIRRKILQEMTNISNHWPSLGACLHDVVEQKMYEGWGFKDFMEYIEQELRVRHGIPFQIIDASTFFKKHFPDLFAKALDAGVASNLPSYEDVRILQEFEHNKSIGNLQELKDVAKLVFEKKLFGKELVLRLAEVSRQVNMAGFFGAQYPRESSESQGSPISHRNIWDSVLESRVQKGLTQSQSISKQQGFTKSQTFTQHPESSGNIIQDTKEGSSTESDTRSLPVVIPRVFPNISPIPHETSVPLANNLPISNKPSSPTNVSSQPALPPKFTKIFPRHKHAISIPKIFQGGTSWFMGIILVGIFIFCMSVYMYRDWQVQNNKAKIQEILSQAEKFEMEQNWVDAILLYRRAKSLIPLTEQDAIDEKISTIENQVSVWATSRHEFIALQQKGQLLEASYKYQEALRCYEQAYSIAQKNPMIFHQDRFLTETIRNLPTRISYCRSSHEILVNKNMAFREAYFIAEKAMEKGNWKEAYLAYQRAYEIDSSYNAEMDKKMKLVETKYQKIKEEEFEAEQVRKGLIKHQGRWITPEGKMEADGFQRYQGQWVSLDLYEELQREEKRVRERIQYIEKLMLQKREEASKIYIIILQEGKKYRGEIISQNDCIIEMKVIFNNGYIQHQWLRSAIAYIGIENGIYEEYYKKFTNPQSLSEQIALLEWAKENQIQELVQLAHYRIFFIDFSHPQYQRIPMVQKNSIWYKK